VPAQFLPGRRGRPPPYPPCTLVEVQRLFDDMIVEVESTFYAPTRR
jgi:2-iminobutanoate/2-iminopropanoate deaminase